MADIGEGEHPRRVEILPVTPPVLPAAPTPTTAPTPEPAPAPAPGETRAGRSHRDNSSSTRPPQGFGGAGLAGGSGILLSVNFFHPSPTGSTGMASIANKLDKAYESKPVEELAAAPVTALQGVSDGDAEHLKAAFGIVTVADLGTNKFFLWAQAITKLAE